MESIQALLIDDEEQNRASIESRFRHHFQALGWQVIWSYSPSVVDARHVFAQPGIRFDLIVVDLLHARDDALAGYEPYGVELIAEARERYPQAFILALSNGEDSSWPDIFRDAEHNGAHLVLRRVEFSTGSRYHHPAAVTKQIYDHLLAVGSLHPMTLTYDDFDPDILALVHEVGDATLLGLQSRVLEASRQSARTVNVSFLVPGASGAAVCAVESVIERTDSKIHHVLKMSRDRATLALEADRAAQAATMMRASLLVKTETSEPVGPVNGWWAIASQLQPRAVTLRTWLGQASPADVKDVFAALFTYGLSDLHSETRRDVGSPIGLLRLPPFRQCRIKRVIEEFEPILTHPSGCGMDVAEVEQLIKVLRLFVLDETLVDTERRQISQPTYESYVHGDLHADNILIYQSRRPSPILIDPSGFEPAHWAADPARLAVDLLLRSVDARVDSLLFEGFQTWRLLAAQLGLLESMGAAVNRDTGTIAALTALTWLTDNLRSCCEVIATDDGYRKHGWEWRAALAMYFLRSTYNAAIPAPKRALALVAAYDQLRGAAAAVPR